jgi:hypothetical protein
MSEKHIISHEIASKVVKQMFLEGQTRGLAWEDLLITIETVIAIGVAAIIELRGDKDKIRASTEFINMITKRAHNRIIASIQGTPFKED